jgi:hypothetical protein
MRIKGKTPSSVPSSFLFFSFFLFFSSAWSPEQSVYHLAGSPANRNGVITHTTLQMEHLVIAILALALGVAFCLVYIDDKCKRARMITTIVPIPDDDDKAAVAIQSIVRRKSAITLVGSRRAQHKVAIASQLRRLGESASIELSPGQVCGKIDPAKKRYTLLSAFDQAPAGEMILLPKTKVFVNMVKTSCSHFDEVADAVRALRSLDLQPVPHLPACRFESQDEAENRLAQLHDASSSSGNEQSRHTILLIGGNDQFERGEMGAQFASASALLQTGEWAPSAVITCNA